MSYTDYISPKKLEDWGLHTVHGCNNTIAHSVWVLLLLFLSKKKILSSQTPARFSDSGVLERPSMVWQWWGPYSFFVSFVALRWKIVQHKPSMEHEIRPSMHYGWGKVALFLDRSHHGTVVQCIVRFTVLGQIKSDLTDSNVSP